MCTSHKLSIKLDVKTAASQTQCYTEHLWFLKQEQAPEISPENAHTLEKCLSFYPFKDPGNFARRM